MTQPVSDNPSHPTTRQSYAYPGGTLHLEPWAWCSAGVGWIWLTWWTHRPATLQSQHGLILVGFGITFILGGLYVEWTLRNQPGRITVNDQGLTCTLPWGRARYFRWEDIREVRCIARRFHRDIAFWEIRGLMPKDRVLITWELKGYKDLLWTIQQRATHCQRFDDIA